MPQYAFPCCPFFLGPSGNSPVSLQEQLAAKQLCHNLLLAAFHVGGVLPHLSAAHLLDLLEHSEMLAAVLNVLTVITDLQGERAATGPEDQPGESLLKCGLKQTE
jgi:hypothetical protein